MISTTMTTTTTDDDNINVDRGSSGLLPAEIFCFKREREKNWSQKDPNKLLGTDRPHCHFRRIAILATSGYCWWLRTILSMYSGIAQFRQRSRITHTKRDAATFPESGLRAP